jgi:hypothetical protein
MNSEKTKIYTEVESVEVVKNLKACPAHAAGEGYCRTRIWRKADGTLSISGSWNSEFIPAQIGKANGCYNGPLAWEHTKASAKKIATGEVSLDQWEKETSDAIKGMCLIVASFEGGTEWDERDVWARASELFTPKLKQLESIVERVKSGKLKIGDRNFKAALGQMCKLQG